MLHKIFLLCIGLSVPGLQAMAIKDLIHEHNTIPSSNLLEFAVHKPSILEKKNKKSAKKTKPIRSTTHWIMCTFCHKELPENGCMRHLSASHQAQIAKFVKNNTMSCTATKHSIKYQLTNLLLDRELVYQCKRCGAFMMHKASTYKHIKTCQNKKN